MDRTLVEGQASYVGTRYALADSGRPLRILVVPKQVGGSLAQDRGRGYEHITVEGRAIQVETAKAGQRPHPRTDHMIGTALALKVLLGLPVNKAETFLLEGEMTHVFDCMALANATLCSMVGSDASGQGSNTMIQNCTEHLARTVAILRPNVLLAEGYNKTGWSPSKAAAQVLRVPLPPKNSLTTVDAPHGQVAFISAVHPSRNWFTPTMPSWIELEPLLGKARGIALGS